MKILVLTREFPPYVLGGISYHLRSLYNEIVEQGHEVTVLAGKCPQSWNDLDDSVSDNITVEPVQFGFRKGYYVLYPIAARKKLCSIDIDEFDIAVSHTPLPFQIPDLPLVTKYHDCVSETRQYLRVRLSGFEKIGDSLLHPFRKVIDQKSLRVSDSAIFNSRVNKKGWLNNYEFNGPCSIVHNGVDTDLFFPADVPQEEYVVFVGTTEQKGLSAVIDYADQNLRPVHIVGAAQLEHPNIVCHGRVAQNELREIYAKAATTIHPARFESFGNAILESLACGTPVVTTSQCGASELLTEKTGVITSDLQNGVETAIKFDGGDCRSLAKDHTWQAVANRTIEFLRTTLNNS